LLGFGSVGATSRTSLRQSLPPSQTIVRRAAHSTSASWRRSVRPSGCARSALRTAGTARSSLPIPTGFPPELQVPLPPQDLVADTSRIRDELGYSETLSRDEGLRRAIEWEREQQSDEPPPDYTAEDSAIQSLNLP
jgi:hypothetical protein